MSFDIEKLSAEALNSAFSELMETPEGQKEVQEAGLTYIKQFLREESFLRKVINPVNITKFDTQRAVDTDTVEKVVDIEPGSTASAINFRSESPARYVEAPRYAIPFFTIASPMFEKTEQELFAYESPVIKIIEENSVKDIQEVEDTKFVEFCDDAVALSGNLLQLPGTTRLNAKTILTDGFSLVDQHRLQTDKVLMSNTTFNDVLALPNEQIGSALNSEIVKDGYSYNQLIGKKFIVTTKTNLVPYGQIWFYAKEKYLGNFFILNNTKFYINKIADLIRFKTWEVIGVGLGNVRGVGKVEFGSGVVTS
jgi:hypothetical protein